MQIRGTRFVYVIRPVWGPADRAALLHLIQYCNSICQHFSKAAPMLHFTVTSQMSPSCVLSAPMAIQRWYFEAPEKKFSRSTEAFSPPSTQEYLTAQHQALSWASPKDDLVARTTQPSFPRQTRAISGLACLLFKPVTRIGSPNHCAPRC